MKNVCPLNGGKVFCNSSPKTVRGKGLAGTDADVRTQGVWGHWGRVEREGKV